MAVSMRQKSLGVLDDFEVSVAVVPNVVTSQGEGEHVHSRDEPVREPLRGEKRKKAMQELENAPPKVVKRKMLKEKLSTESGEKELEEGGNFNGVHTSEALSQVSYEGQKSKKLDPHDPWNNLVLNAKQLDTELGKKSIFLLSYSPFGVAWATHNQLQYIKEEAKVSKPFICEVDSTGSESKPVPWDEDKKQVLTYNLVHKRDAPKSSIITLSTFLSNNQHQSEPAHWLGMLRTQYKEVTKSKDFPEDIGVMDMGWCITYAWLHEMCGMSLMQYLHACVQAKAKNVIDFVLALWCYSHLINNTKMRATKLFPLKTFPFSPARKFLKSFVAAMARATELEEVLDIFKWGVIILESEHYTDLVQRAIEAIAIRFGANKEDILNDESAEEDVLPLDDEVSEPDEDAVYVSGPTTYKDSPFFKQFHAAYKKAMGDIDRESESSDLRDNLGSNSLYVPTFVDHLLRYVLPYYCMWSRYMQCILLPGKENPLTNKCVERSHGLDKQENLRKKKFQDASVVMVDLVRGAEDRLLEFNFNTNFKEYKKRQTQEGGKRIEPPAKENAIEKWKPRHSRPPGGHYSRSALSKYGNSLCDKIRRASERKPLVKNRKKDMKRKRTSGRGCKEQVLNVSEIAQDNHSDLTCDMEERTAGDVPEEFEAIADILDMEENAIPQVTEVLVEPHISWGPVTSDNVVALLASSHVTSGDTAEIITEPALSSGDAVWQTPDGLNFFCQINESTIIHKDLPTLVAEGFRIVTSNVSLLPDSSCAVDQDPVDATLEQSGNNVSTFCLNTLGSSCDVDQDPVDATLEQSGDNVSTFCLNTLGSSCDVDQDPVDATLEQSGKNVSTFCLNTLGSSCDVDQDPVKATSEWNVSPVFNTCRPPLTNFIDKPEGEEKTASPTGITMLSHTTVAVLTTYNIISAFYPINAHELMLAVGLDSNCAVGQDPVDATLEQSGKNVSTFCLNTLGSSCDVDQDPVEATSEWNDSSCAVGQDPVDATLEQSGKNVSTFCLNTLGSSCDVVQDPVEATSEWNVSPVFNTCRPPLTNFIDKPEGEEKTASPTGITKLSHTTVAVLTTHNIISAFYPINAHELMLAMGLDSSCAVGQDPVDATLEQNGDNVSMYIPSKLPHDFPIIKNKFKGFIMGNTIYDRDFSSIGPDQELSDNAIDAFLLVMKVEARTLGAEVLVLPSYLLTLISMGLPIDSGVGPTQLFNDLWLIPAQIERNHWILFAIFMRKKIVLILDSLNKNVTNDTKERLKIVLYLISQGNQAACGLPICWKDWAFHAPWDVVTQKNNKDCGVYVCMWAYALCGRGGLLQKSNNTSTMLQVRNWIATVLYGNTSQMEERTFKVTPDCITQMYPEFDKKKAKGEIQFDRPWEDIVLNKIWSTSPDNRHTKEFLMGFLNELHVASATKCGSPSLCKLPRREDVQMYLCELCREWYHLACIGDVDIDKAAAAYYLCPLHCNEKMADNCRRRRKINAKKM
ncbi:hypothetical protein ONE63_009536 [Megalurothrips usitatus]|uniref:Ubiquitin-like protease family profile domain-containing protein n=1 Tax=Megalurothrips usitatus TaxID=439358 RepID=A0AAV7XMH4_9NEOP|nr:hypothetical protein ONE63_009536 [Megalurothrips usitatus]